VLTRGTERFTDRADVYDAGRPPYPPDLFELYREAFALTAASVVADVGSGTGIHAAQLRRIPVTVVAVEPNQAMRAHSEERFSGDPGVRVVAGSAEATGLGAGSVDPVTAAQAFHWFDGDAFRDECDRILRRPTGRVLVWNVRSPRRNAFTAGYEGLLERFGRGDAESRSRWGSRDEVFRFFGRHPRELVFPNDQRVGRAALEALLDSASYAPARGSAERERAQRELDGLFEAHDDGEGVVLAYDTIVLTDG
jgi:SAM-dependent methyltransferase